MSSQKSVFLIGPGFLGWNVLDQLISSNHTVTALVRRESHATDIRASGAKVVIGDLDDAELITDQTTKHEMIVHTATADHLSSVQAVLAGLRLRAKAEQHSFFIHTSGTNILADGADGAFKSNKIFHDSNRAEIDSVGPKAPHRDVDVPIAEAAQEEGLRKWAKIAIIIPPTIYGANPKHKRVSIQWPTQVRFALKHGFSGYVGEGESVESQVHVVDLARAYLAVLQLMEGSNGGQALLDNPYFFCENGVEFQWKEVADEIGRILFDLGKIDDPTSKSYPVDSYKDLFGKETSEMIGLNSRSRGDRLRSLGWESKEKGWRESLREDEIPLILAELESDMQCS